MNPFLKLAQQSNAELQEVIIASRRSRRRAPDDILREAREKHNFYKSYVSSGNHKSGGCQIGMSRIQFGDGDFAQSVQEMMRFQESEPRPEPLPEIETPVQLTRTLSRTVRPGESLRSASSVLLRRDTSTNLDFAVHHSAASLTSNGGPDTLAANIFTLDDVNTPRAASEADGDGRSSNSQRSRPQGLGATSFAGAFLRSASSRLPEVSSCRTSIDHSTVLQLRGLSHKELHVSSTFDGSTFGAQAGPTPCGEENAHSGINSRRPVSLPNEAGEGVAAGSELSAAVNDGFSQGSGYGKEALRRRPSGVTNPGDLSAVTFAPRGPSFTSSGVLSGRLSSNGAAVVEGDDDRAAAAAATCRTSPERRARYARLEVILPGSAAAMAAVTGSAPRRPSVSGTKPVTWNPSAQTPSTERTDRLLRILQQEQPRRNSNSSFLSPSSGSSSNISLDCDTPAAAARQRFGMSRMRHLSWRAGESAAARLLESSDVSDWAGSDGGALLSGGDGFQDAAQEACNSAPAAVATAHVVNVRSLVLAPEPLRLSPRSPESQPASPFRASQAVLAPATSTVGRKPKAASWSALSPEPAPSSELQASGTPPSTTPAYTLNAASSSGEIEQIPVAGSAPAGATGSARRSSGTALTGWSSQQRRPEERDRKPRHTAPSGDSFTDVATVQRIALAQLARAIGAGSSTGGVKRSEGHNFPNKDDDEDGAALALALLSKSAASIAGREGLAAGFKGLPPQAGLVAVKAKEKGWRR